MSKIRQIIIKSLYIVGEDIKNCEQVERLAAAEKISYNAMMSRIVKDWLEINKRYKDAKITDYETVEVLKIKESTPVYCKECGSYEVDEAGWVIHDIGCNSSRPFYSGVEK